MRLLVEQDEANFRWWCEACRRGGDWLDNSERHAMVAAMNHFQKVHQADEFYLHMETPVKEAADVPPAVFIAG